MTSYRTAAVFIAALTSMSMYSQAFTSPKLSSPKSGMAATTAKPFGLSVSNPISISTALQMGMVEDFLAGTDNEKRKAENEVYVANLAKRVDKINQLEPTIEDLGDDELLAKTAEFRKRLADGEDINGPIMEEAFAVVREAAW
jgi:hypothetical protein